MKNTFKEIEKENKKVNAYTLKMKNTPITGGIFDKGTEKKYRRAVDSWKKYFVSNKTNSNNIKFINSITFDVKGDITKTKDFYKSIQFHKKNLEEIIKNISSKDVEENSYISIFLNVCNLITDTKYINGFKVAYEDYEKNKGKVQGSISDIIIMCNQIMTSFIYYSIGILNPNTINKYLTLNNLNNENKKEFIDYLNETQNIYWSIISELGFTSLEIVKVFENIKNPVDEIKKAIKEQKDSSDKLAKAKESHDTVILQNTIYEIGEESYLEDELDFGKEEALTVALIVLGSIVGLIALIAGIRRAIYLCGTLKTDISDYIKVDVVTIMMNIESLKNKLDNTENPKERKKIQSIIDKQESFVNKYKSKYSDIALEGENASYESEYVIEDEDKSDDNSSSYNNDYEILL